jgi:hypothetical protein
MWEGCIKYALNSIIGLFSSMGEGEVLHLLSLFLELSKGFFLSNFITNLLLDV